MDVEVQSGEPESGKEFVELNDNLGHAGIKKFGVSQLFGPLKL